MNWEEYRGTLDRLTPPLELKERIQASLEAPAGVSSHRRRRAGLTALAVAAVLACTFLAAMPASPQLRTAVLTLLRLEETEQVPAPTGDRPEEPELTQGTVGQQVEVQYIRLPDAGSGCDYNNNTIFQVDRADDGSILDVHYWAIAGNELVPLETNTTRFSTVWDGVTYTDTVYWCEYQGVISCYNNGTAGMALDYNCTVSALEGRTDVVLLNLSQGKQMDYRKYPVLLDLETGEVTGLLDDTSWEIADPLTGVLWTDDLSAAILSSDRMGWFYCDRQAQTTANLNALTGLEVFSAYFANDSTLILLTLSGPDGACYDIWTWQPDSGQLIRTFSQLPVYQKHEEQSYGFQFFFGGGRGIYVAEDGGVSVLDLVTGGITAVEGFSLSQTDGTLLPNPSGSKVLFADHNAQTEGLGISSLGVMDLEKGTFTLLDREHYDAVYEGVLGWFDEDRVAITAHGKDDYNQTYLYLYRF